MQSAEILWTGPRMTRITWQFWQHFEKIFAKEL